MTKSVRNCTSESSAGAERPRIGPFRRPGLPLSGLLLCGLLLCGFLIPASTAWPLSGLSLDVLVGFNGRFKEGHWTPLLITLSNRGPRVDGRLRVELTRGDAYRNDERRILFEKRLLLPESSTKRYSFVVPIEKAYRPLRLAVIENEEEILEEMVDVDGMETTGRIVLGLSREASLDLLSVLSTNVPQLENPDRIRVIYPLVEYLPASWAAFDAVEAVIFHNAPLDSLREEQVEALEKWVAGGGTVVVSGGPHLAPSTARALGRLLPVDVVGQAVIRDPYALERRFGGDLDDREPLVVTLSTVKSGEILLEQDGVPLLVEESRGRGRVVFLAFDHASHPIRTWEGAADLWRTVLPDLRAAAPSSPPEEREPVFAEPEPEEEPSLLSAALSVPIRHFPSHLVVIGLLGVYLAALFALLRRRSRVSRAVGIAASLALAAALALGSYLAFDRWLLKRDILYADLSVVTTSPGMQWAELRKEISLLSALPQTHSVTLEGEGYLLDPRGADGLIQTERGETVVSGIALAPWAVRRFTAETVVPFPSEGGAVRDGGLLRIRLENRAPYPIRDAVFVYRGVPYFAGDIQTGEEIREDFRMTQDPGNLRESVTLETVFREEDTSTQIHVALLERLLRLPEWNYADRPDIVLLIGRLEETPRRAAPATRFVHESRHTIVGFIFSPGSGDREAHRGA